MRQSTRAKHALLAAGVCFLIIDVLLAASIGVVDWFTLKTKDRAGTSSSELKLGVSGRIVQALWFPESACSVHVEVNVWTATLVERKCTVLSGWSDRARNTCNRVCSELESLVGTDVTTCSRLAAASKDATASLAAYLIWYERAVCTGAMWVLVALVSALVTATIGAGMCCYALQEPWLARRMIIPGLLCPLCSASAVIAYGAAITVDFPHDSMAYIAASLGATGSTEVSKEVPVGLFLASLAAALSLVACRFAFMVVDYAEHIDSSHEIELARQGRYVYGGFVMPPQRDGVVLLQIPASHLARGAAHQGLAAPVRLACPVTVVRVEVVPHVEAELHAEATPASGTGIANAERVGSSDGQLAAVTTLESPGEDAPQQPNMEDGTSAPARAE